MRSCGGLPRRPTRSVEIASVRERFEALGVVIEPPERRTIDYFVRNLPREIERAAVLVKAGGLSTE